MHIFSAKMILVIMIISVFVGLGVILLKKDYTIQNNIKSNIQYYPSVKLGEKK